MIGLFRNPQMANRNKFSYATAQEYCQLVKRSIDRVNSQSKNSPSSATAQIKIPPKPPQNIKKQPAFQRLRQRIRSRSNSNRQSAQKSRSLSRCQITNLNSNNESQNSKQIESSQRKVSSYESEHLLSSLQRENTQLREVIKQTQSKAEKIRQKIEEQRNSQNVQRDLYEQQVRKLKQTLQMQIKCRLKPQQQQPQVQCSIGEIMHPDLSQKQL